MEILNHINENEVIEINAECKVGSQIKSTLLANLMYIILWVAFDVFFVYIITIESIQQDFWFITIPVCGFNLLIVWTYVFKVLKEKASLKGTGYILTDKAFYYYADNKYKQLQRIDLQDIITVEKSEYIADGFYVASLTNNIHVKNIQEEKELFDALVQKVKA